MFSSFFCVSLYFLHLSFLPSGDCHSFNSDLYSFLYSFIRSFFPLLSSFCPYFPKLYIHSFICILPRQSRPLTLVLQPCRLYNLPSTLGRKCLRKICRLVKFHLPTTDQAEATAAPCSPFPFPLLAPFSIAESRSSGRFLLQTRRIAMPQCRPFPIEWLTKPERLNGCRSCNRSCVHPSRKSVAANSFDSAVEFVNPTPLTWVQLLVEAPIIA